MDEIQESSKYKWLIAVTVMTGTIMAAMDMSIVNVALPHIRATMGASVEEISWVATGYILSSVIIMPIVAMLSSLFGRKRFLNLSVVLFTGASMLCGLAWDLNSLILFRIIQGIGGGALIPTAMAVLRETFPAEEQAKAMGVYGFGVMLGPAIAPTLGGWLTDNYSWPWVFFINVPIGIANILLVLRYIKDPPFLIREKGKMDLAGLLFMAGGLGALQILLEKGNPENWFASNFIIYLAVISGLGFLFFIWRELTTEKPAVNLRILKDLNFSSGTFLGGLLGMGLMGGLFALPLFLQQLLDYPALDSGLALLPRSLAMLMAMPIGGRLYNRTGPRILIGGGLFLTGVSFYQFSRLSLDVGYWDIFAPQFLQGIGFGFVFVSLSTASLSTIEKPLLTAASGLYTVVRQVFGSIGIAVTATLLTRGENWYMAVLSEKINPYRDIASITLQKISAYFYSRGLDQVAADNSAVKLIGGIVRQQASMLSFNHVYFLIAVLFFISIPLIFLIKDNRLASFK
jgi:MFS transporter, DHA2 family, multidrug resistance protein